MAFKRGCLATILLFASLAVAQGRYTVTEAPAFTARGAFIAIVVSDLDASVSWYESMLGLHLVKRGKSTRVPAETAVLSGHNLFVELIHHEGKPLSRLDNEASVPRLIKAGVIVAGSNNSRNGPMKASADAWNAMWNDTHERFAVDDKRVYATGLSGGAGSRIGRRILAVGAMLLGALLGALLAIQIETAAALAAAASVIVLTGLAAHLLANRRPAEPA
jgi:catechol 2,3-dioxygenase-like lactoylglutathione lyase family enzyme